MGITLGLNGDHLPLALMTDYVNTGSLEHLNVTGNIYVSWLLDPNLSHEATRIVPPKPITDWASPDFAHTWLS